MVIAAILGYLFGSIPSAVLVGRKLGVDPRERGDGNPGWWNMRHQVGDKPAFAVFALDIIKGAVPVLIVSNLWGPWWWAYVAGFFALVGHAFPLFANFRGGKSVLTFMGAMAVLAPWTVLATVTTGIVVAIAFRKFPYGAWVMVWGVPLVQLFMQPIERIACTGALMTFIGVRFLAGYIAGLSIAGREHVSPA